MVKAKRTKKPAQGPPGECTIPEPVPIAFVDQVILNRPEHQADEIREYVAYRTDGEKVLHLERLATEHVFDRQIEGWDVWTDQKRYWVITSPMNIYSQEVFPSLDYTITFHVGLSMRMSAIESRKASKEQRDRLATAWRKWEQAADAFGLANEAEEFQIVGMRCRESLIALVHSIANDSMVPEGQESPKASDVIHWTELIANAIARGPASECIRGYLKASAKSTWQMINWLTHASNAVRFDGRMALDATQAVISAFGMALLRYEIGAPDCCPRCTSYRIDTVYHPELAAEQEYFSLCESCGWTDLPTGRRAAKEPKRRAARKRA